MVRVCPRPTLLRMPRNLAAVFIQDPRQVYISSARREFARLKSHRDDNAHSTDRISYRSERDRYEVLSMQELSCLLPVRQSATLADLVDEMIGLRMKIVVQFSTDDSH